MMIRIGKTVPYWIWIFLASCGPQSFEDLRCEGEFQTKKLALELRQIESKEDLQKALPRLKKRFNQMADLLLEIKKFPHQDAASSLASEALFAELARLYELPGGRECIELAQTDAVQKLQAND